MTYNPNDDPRYIIDLRNMYWLNQVLKIRGMETLLTDLIEELEGTYPKASYIDTLHANLQYAKDVYVNRHTMKNEIMDMVQTCVKEIHRQENEEKTRWLGLTDTLETD